MNEHDDEDWTWIFFILCAHFCFMLKMKFLFNNSIMLYAHYIWFQNNRIFEVFFITSRRRRCCHRPCFLCLIIFYLEIQKRFISKIIYLSHLKLSMWVSERIVYLCGGDDVNDFVCTYYYYYCSKQQLIGNRSVWYSYIHIDAKKSLTHKSENCFLIIFCLQCMYILCGWFEMLTIIIISNFWSVQQVIFKRASDNARERVLTNPIS